jgi:non-specific serine/threonine protein kinase
LVHRQRLVTLTGPGGVGKTRLAVEASTRLLRKFGDGVWWIELAPLTDETLIPHAVAGALGVSEVLGQSLTAGVAQFLRSRQALLVLDNCEHLIAGCARLAYSLLTQCADLKVLATSREPLDVTGETPYPVPALSLPRPEHQTLADLLLEFESIRLFVERAGQKSGFRLSDDNAAAVLQICRRLDGIPLALELAAARTPLLTAEQIAERLSDRFKLLTHGSRAALPRQQTLRATLDWSHDLLTPKEQALFRRLAVFAGGWTRDAAQAVCAGGAIAAEDILDLLTDLAQKSLVTLQTHADEARYHMLETIGAYAREKLERAAEAELFGNRHRDWFQQLAEAVRRDGQLTGSGERLDRIAREHDNFRAALHGSLRQDHAAQALRFTYLLAYFWGVRSHWSEGRAWIERALETARLASEGAAPPEARLTAQSLCALGMLAVGQRDFGAAQDVLTQSLGLYRRQARAQGLDLEAQDGMAVVLNYLGFAAYYQGDYPRAMAHYQEALALYRGLEAPDGIGFTLTMMSRVAISQGQYGHAMQLGEESTAIGRTLNNTHLTSAALDVTGRALYSQGEFPRALARLEESLALAHELDFKQDVVDLLNKLGLVAFYQGDHGGALGRVDQALSLSQTLNYSMGRACAWSTQAEVALAENNPARARQLLAESLAAFRQLGMKLHMLRCLEIQAAIDAAERQPVRAARLCGAAAAARAALGAPLPPPDRPAYERAAASARAQLGEAAFAAAWDEGSALTLEQAVEAPLL